jgi:hypothetical protein
VVAILMPGVRLAIVVVAFLAVTSGSVSSGALAIAMLAFILASFVFWRESRGNRLDHRVAEELLHRQGWDESIEVVGRPPGISLIWRGTIWIATDKRLIEASRPRWWRPHQPQSVLWSVSYDGITAIRRVRTRGGGETPRFTAITLAIGSDELKMSFSPRKAKATLASITDHTGLVVPPT